MWWSEEGREVVIPVKCEGCDTVWCIAFQSNEGKMFIDVRMIKEERFDAGQTYPGTTED